VNANMFVWRHVFSTVGLFRAGVAEDVDWGYRSRALPFRMRYAADAIVEHPARREWTDLIEKWRLATHNHYALARERRFGKLRFLARSWLILISPMVHIPWCWFRANSTHSINGSGRSAFWFDCALAIFGMQSSLMEDSICSGLGPMGRRTTLEPTRILPGVHSSSNASSTNSSISAPSRRATKTRCKLSPCRQTRCHTNMVQVYGSVT
jgi:hypothetical protein